MLGVKIDPGYKGGVLRSLETHIAARRHRRSRSLEVDEFPFDQDDYFAYIAGYTAAGFAYGITWEEWERLDQDDLPAETEKE